MIFIIDSKHHSVINLEKTNKLFLSPSNEKGAVTKLIPPKGQF